jgi:hypothetical protein
MTQQIGMQDIPQTDGYDGYASGSYGAGAVFPSGGLGDLATSATGSAVVATTDTGTAGDLKIHDLPDASSLQVGAASRGGTVKIIDNPAHVGSAAVPGWVQVAWGGDAQNPAASGFASAAYLAPAGSAPPSPSPSNPIVPAGSSNTLLIGAAVAAALGIGAYFLLRK